MEAELRVCLVHGMRSDGIIPFSFFICLVDRWKGMKLLISESILVDVGWTNPKHFLECSHHGNLGRENVSEPYVLKWDGAIALGIVPSYATSLSNQTLPKIINVSLKLVFHDITKGTGSTFYPPNVLCTFQWVGICSRFQVSIPLRGILDGFFLRAAQISHSQWYLYELPQ